MNNVKHATQEEELADLTRVTLNFPVPVWKEVKKAAIDADKTAQQFVIDAMEKVIAAGAA